MAPYGNWTLYWLAIVTKRYGLWTNLVKLALGGLRTASVIITAFSVNKIIVDVYYHTLSLLLVAVSLFLVKRLKEKS